MTNEAFATLIAKTFLNVAKSFFEKFIVRIYAETADKLFESSTFVQRF